MFSISKPKPYLAGGIVAFWSFFSWLLVTQGHLSFKQRWIGEALLMMVLLLCLGAVIARRPLGILIDERNLMSLSRFQLIVWTVLLVSALLTMGVLRILARDVVDPFELKIDEHLWLLLGISTAAAVGSPLVRGTKENKAPDDKDAALLSAKQRTGVAESDNRGLLYVKTSSERAEITDLFTGEQLGDAGLVDVAKVQMFVFTAVSALAYGVALYRAFDTTDPAKLAFPDPSQGLVALLGISQVTHLLGKIPDKKA